MSIPNVSTPCPDPKTLYAVYDAVLPVADTLHLEPALPKAERRNVRAKAALVPLDFLESAASVAERSGSRLAHVEVSASDLRAAIAYAHAAQPLLALLRGLADRLEDDVARRLAGLDALARAGLRAVESAEEVTGPGPSETARILRAARPRQRRRPKREVAEPGLQGARPGPAPGSAED